MGITKLNINKYAILISSILKSVVFEFNQFVRDE